MVATGRPLNGFIKLPVSMDQNLGMAEDDFHPRYQPCACGKEFDDVEFSVIYPHNAIPEKVKVIWSHEGCRTL